MLKPIPNHYDYFGRQINEGDVYSFYDLSEGIKHFKVCLWLPQYFRHAWLPFDIYQERGTILEEFLTCPTDFFEGEETYEGNIFSNPDLIAA